MSGRDGYVGRRQESWDHAWENIAFYIWAEYRIGIDGERLETKWLIHFIL